MRFRSACRLWWLVLPVILVDRASKLLAIHLLAPRGVQTAIPGVLSWSFTKNTGAAFGLMSGSWLLPLLTAALIAGLLAWLLRHPQDPPLFRSGLWLIIGGGMSNLYDRIAYGYVVDFIRTDFVRFAVFNLADVCICLGAGLALVSVLISEGRKARHG